MPYEERFRTQDTAHNIIMESRSKVSVTGVEDVESFDENCIVMMTSRGALSVNGSELHLEKLNLDSGEVVIEGTVNSLEYEDDGHAETGGFFSRLFG